MRRRRKKGRREPSLTGQGQGGGTRRASMFPVPAPPISLFHPLSLTHSLSLSLLPRIRQDVSEHAFCFFSGPCGMTLRRRSFADRIARKLTK